MNKKCKICGCDDEIIVNGICRDCIDELQRKSEDAEIESYLKGHNDKVDSLQSQLAAAQERIAELEDVLHDILIDFCSACCSPCPCDPTTSKAYLQARAALEGE